MGKTTISMAIFHSYVKWSLCYSTDDNNNAHICDQYVSYMVLYNMFTIRALLRKRDPSDDWAFRHHIFHATAAIQLDPVDPQGSRFFKTP